MYLSNVLYNHIGELKMDKINELAQLIKKSELTTIFTGAGMSTDSGLPDYRSSRGLWSTNKIELSSNKALNDDFENFIEFYRERVINLGEHRPNLGHDILSKWQNAGLIGAIITQNVDGFHQMSGAQYVIELHGTLKDQRCLGCRKVYKNTNKIENNCDNCHGRLRPCVVLYGESLPSSALQDAILESSRSQVFIAMGSSLQVAPANSLPLKAKYAGAQFVIINNEETVMDADADLIIRGNISEILAKLDKILDKQ